MIPALKDVKRMPARGLTDAEHFVIEIDGYMRDIRLEANRMRQSAWKCGDSHIKYLIGRLHGYRFGAAAALIHRGECCYGELADWADGLMNEARFLSEEYQQP